MNRLNCPAVTLNGQQLKHGDSAKYLGLYLDRRLRVLKYLSCTKSYGLMLVKNNLDLVGFVDADEASDNLDRKSYTLDIVLCTLGA